MRSLAVVALGLVAACGPAVQTTLVNPAPRPLAPRHPASVEIFTSAPPQRPYVDVALLEAADWDEVRGDTAVLLSELRKQAAALGCDAIVFNGITTQSGGDLDHTQKAVYATCIAYRTPDDPALAMAHHARVSHDQCLAERAETLALAGRVDDPKAKASIAGAAPSCD